MLLLLLGGPAACLAMSSSDTEPRQITGQGTSTIGPQVLGEEELRGDAEGAVNGQVAGALRGSPSGSPGSTGGGDPGTGGGTNAAAGDPDGGTPGGGSNSLGVHVGSLKAVYPGVGRTLPVTFSNPNSFHIEVTSYRVRASVPAGAGVTCSPSYLRVPIHEVTLTHRIALADGARATVPVPVTLRRTAPDACQGVTFRVTVTATAVRG